MAFISYLASALIGILLGLIGGGGSILTIPVLVYLFGINPLLSTSYSLFIVGSTSLVGAANSFRHKLVNLHVAAWFGLSSVAVVYLVRRFLLPAIPAGIVQIVSFRVNMQTVTLSLFALLMIAAALAMIRPQAAVSVRVIKCRRARLLATGTVLGLVTGLLGAGGGFLLIPALVMIAGLPMKEAVATSLFIISVNSLVGFVGDWGHFHINWSLLVRITMTAVAGMFAGAFFARRIDGARLKAAFGWFILVMGTIMLLRPLF